MQPSERSTMYHILSRVKPDISLEIGTFLCGSLHSIAANSSHVYTFDIDDRQRDGFTNVTFRCGPSRDTVPLVIDEINRSPREVNFILVDGAHDTEGVHADLMNCLAYIPKRRPTIIVMHDSANPDVRRGIDKVDWNLFPHVHMVDLDFVPGMLYDRPDIEGQIWGGLAIALLLPQARTQPLAIDRNFEHSLQALKTRSVYGAS
jgi:hypothetical protein